MAARSIVFSYLGKLVNIRVGEDNQALFMDFYTIGSSSNKVLLEHTLTWRNLSQSKGRQKSIICAKCVLAEKVHVKLPFFAVTSEIQGRNGKVKRITVFTLFNGQICQVKCFPSPLNRGGEEDGLECYDFHLLDGPTLLMCHKRGTCIFLGRMDANPALESLDLSTIGQSCNKYHVNSTELKCFAQDPWNKSFCCIAVLITTEEPTCREKILHEYINFPLISSNSAKSSTSTEHRDTLDTCLVPPELYLPYTTAFVIFNKADLYHWNYELPMEQKESRLFAISTEHKQFLIFHANESLMCCSIPISDCVRISLIKLPNEETGFFLLSRSHDACLVSWKNKKVIHQWNAVKDVCFDDFLLNGHNQILILFSSLKPLDGVQFCLTDFHCCHVDSRASPLPSQQQQHDSQAVDSLHSVVNALSANVEAVKAKIRDNEVLARRKQTLIDETWLSMENMVINGNSMASTYEGNDNVFSGDDGLVSFFDSHDQPSSNAAFGGVVKSAKPFVVLDQKQAVVFDKWVVIVKVKIVEKRRINSLSLSIMAVDHTSESCIVSLPQHGANEPNMIKNKGDVSSETPTYNPISRQDHQELFLAAKTNVPDFSKQKEVNASLVVNWQENCNPMKDDASTNSSVVGSIKLKSIDLIKGLYKTVDRMFFETAAHHAKFCIVSEQCKLTSLEALIRNELKSANCKLFVSNQDDIFIRRKTFEECSEIYLEFSRSGESVEVEIFSRNEAEANQLRHLMASLIPADAEMCYPLAVLRDLVSRLSQSLKKELDIVKRFAENAECRSGEGGIGIEQTDVDMKDGVLEEDCIGGKNDMSSQLTANKVNDLRQQFQRKRKRDESFLKGSAASIKLDNDTYKTYLNAMQESDAIASMLFARNFADDDNDIVISSFDSTDFKLR
eukprot:gene17043-18758_t